jgi:hypothetical protein
MKLKLSMAIISLLIGCLFASPLLAQTVVFPANFEQQVQAEYNALADKEVTYDKYLEYKRRVFIEQSNIATGVAALYNGCANGNTICGNGDFESGLNTAEWSGAFGSISSAAPNANPATMTAGFSALNLPFGNASGRHTLVQAGNDPITGVSMVAPGGSTQALRLGNSAAGSGTELISKRIAVVAGQTSLSFMYAAVLQLAAGHTTDQQATFRVRVVDCATGLELLNVCNLGNNSSQISPNISNPFFLTSTVNPSVVYTPWMCAQLNLAAHIGKTVSIQFITEDCSLSGHFGYVYLDNFCTATNCSSGNVSVRSNPDCGPGQICVSYSLPQSNGQTGTAQLSLSLYQNGVLLQTLNSPLLSSGSNYCFSITPAGIPGINDNLLGYDFTVTGNFAISGFSLAPITAGNPPTGQVNGQNNDALIYCVNQCCPGNNLIKNPGFELGNQSFASSYSYQAAVAANSVSTGRYGIMTSAQGLAVSPTWNVNCPSNGRHLYVNGATGLTTAPKIVWQQGVTITNGKFYKFCVDMKNLPQCGFDVKPKVNVKFTLPGFDITNRVINVPAGACNWQSVNQVITAPSGAGTTLLVITITLDETGIGDGNDLALDNFTLVEIPQVPQSDVLFNISYINPTATTVGVSATPLVWPVRRDCGYYWSVEEVTGANNTTVANTGVYNPSQWWGPYPNTFPGYNGTNVLSGVSAGVFDINKRYRIVYGRWCECEAWNSRGFIIDVRNRQAVVDDKYVLSPEQIAAIMASPSSASSSRGTATAVAEKPASGAPIAVTAAKAVSPITAQVMPQSIQVYPNPANDQLTVVLPRGSAGGQVALYDAKGVAVKRIPIGDKRDRLSIDIGQLGNGTYVVQFIAANGVAGGKEKFVKIGK